MLLSTVRSNLPLANFRALAARRGAALALALRLYTLDHAGHFPAQLQDLVPDYLPSVPSDPFSATNNSFIYNTTTSPPLLYSVGVNGIDDHGKGRHDWWNHFKEEITDFLIPLAAPK